MNLRVYRRINSRREVQNIETHDVRHVQFIYPKVDNDTSKRFSDDVKDQIRVCNAGKYRYPVWDKWTEYDPGLAISFILRRVLHHREHSGSFIPKWITLHLRLSG